MQSLLDPLRGQSVDRALEEAEWNATLTLAEEEGVLPWVAAQVRLRQDLLPPAISNRFMTVERDAAVAAFYWSSELKGVLRALDASGIMAVPLKGPFLAERLYGGTPLRVSRDLDVLVSTGDLVRAEAVLASIGFIPGLPDDYHRQWHRGTTTVELHHDVENPVAFNFHVANALREARATEFQGERCWQLAPEDELLFLCLHAVRHQFERLSLILDLQLAFEKWAGPVSAWEPRPEVDGLGGLLTLGLAMARRMQPDLIVAPRFAVSPARTRHLEELADRLWDRLLTERGERLDWRALHSFYVEVELPGRDRLRRRLRHLRILVERVIDRDYRFAAELGLRRPWQAWMLRPLRLLTDFVRH
jgi:hypothetical protein